MGGAKKERVGRESIVDRGESTSFALVTFLVAPDPSQDLVLDVCMYVIGLACLCDVFCITEQRATRIEDLWFEEW